MTDQTRTGAKIQNFRAAKPKAFATQDGPDERNPVFDKRKKDQTLCRLPRPLSILVSTIQRILVDVGLR